MPTEALAGLAIAGLLLPEAVAYSGIAGLPPQAGVIALFAGLFSYAIIGRSPYAIVAATSSSAAILAAGTITMAGADSVSRPLIAATLVGLTGLIFLLGSAVKLGGLSNLIARPVLRGYAFGLALVIAVKQLPHLLGLDSLHGDFLPRVVISLFDSLPEINQTSAITGTIALIILFLCERLKKIPGSLVVIILGIIASTYLAGYGVELTGTIKFSLDLSLPALPDRSQWFTSIQLGAALFLILYAESYSSIRGLALKHGEKVYPNRDLAALGVANLISGLLHGLPVGAGYSATSANEAAGAKTRISGLIAACAILLMVILLLEWIERIPQPILAAIVIHAVSKSWRLKVFAPYFKWQRDRIIALVAIVAVLTLGILNGLLVAIACSIALLLHHLIKPRLSVLGRIDDSHNFIDITHHPNARPITGIMILRPEVPLFFANAESIFGHIREHISSQDGLEHVILSLELTPDMDGTVLEALGDFSFWLEKQKVILHLARLKDSVREVLIIADLPGLAAEKLNCWSVDDAVQSVSSESNHSRQDHGCDFASKDSTVS